MKAKLLIVLVVGVLIAACSKDKYETKPTLKFVSINGDAFAQPSNIRITLEVTDKEGDIGTGDDHGVGQDTIWTQRFSFVCPDQNVMDPIPYVVPAFAHVKHLKAQIELNYTYGGLQNNVPISGCELKNDSTYFKYWIKDKAGNVSDTITTSTFVLLKS